MSLSVDLSGRPALVTGASGGLGAHFARTLARHGAPVVLAARRVDRLEALAESIAAEGGTSGSVGAACATAEAAVGTVRIVVNNSGIARGDAALDVSEDDWDEVLDTNLKGAFLVARELASRMVHAGGGGSIVNVASILGFRAAPGLASYSASKAGLKHLTGALALELARHDIRVNAIAPGYIETDMNRDFFESAAGKAMIKRIPQRRLGRPEDLDGALLLLASDASAYMTGTTVVVDGGHLFSSL